MTTLKIAIQKSGRLKDGSMKLLHEAGLSFSAGKDQLKAQASNFPATLYFLRDDDIPEYVADQVADLGIVGENVFLEKNKDTPLVKRLGFARCRLSMAAPRTFHYTGVSCLEGKKIATSYPVIVNSFLKKNKVRAEIHEISGSVEIAPGIGLADVICDLVSTGSTLLSNGLAEVETILKSEAILIGSPHLDDEKTALLNQLLFRIDAVQSAEKNKYILMNCPDRSIEKITSLIPGMNSPTITPLARKGWSSLHSVVDENDFWEKIDLLKSLGAEGILVVPIEYMIA
ncbi:MAG: ATP phosphoribosyltransferase [Candidatus Nephrothrix sp. EaCA]|nr:MAG: ATP phosphoribosyltransferase [Candidatus Nephrothrix sp. EaCA]